MDIKLSVVFASLFLISLLAKCSAPDAVDNPSLRFIPGAGGGTLPAVTAGPDKVGPDNKGGVAVGGIPDGAKALTPSGRVDAAAGAAKLAVSAAIGAATAAAPAVSAATGAAAEARSDNVIGSKGGIAI